MRYQDFRLGQIVRDEDDGLPPPPPQEPATCSDVTPREIVVAILRGLRAGNVIITDDQMRTIRDAIINYLKK